MEEICRQLTQLGMEVECPVETMDPPFEDDVLFKGGPTFGEVAGDLVETKPAAIAWFCPRDKGVDAEAVIYPDGRAVWINRRTREAKTVSASELPNFCRALA